MQTDPIGTTGGVNLYAYDRSDPVNLIDPSGLEPCQYGVNNSWSEFRHSGDPAGGTNTFTLHSSFECLIPEPPGMLEQLGYLPNGCGGVVPQSCQGGASPGAGPSPAPEKPWSPPDISGDDLQSISRLLLQREPRCNNPEYGRTVLGDFLTVGAATAVVAGVLIANVVGFPEVEFAELVAAEGGIAVFTNTERFSAVAFSSLHFGAYGALVGGATGAITTSRTVACNNIAITQYLGGH